MSEVVGVMSDDFQRWLFADLIIGDASPTLHLGSTTTPVSASTTLTSLQADELVSSSYAPVTITPSDVGYIGSSTPGFYQLAEQDFNLGADAASVTVGSWWIEGTDPFTLDHVLWAGSVSPPFVVPPAGGTVAIGPLDLPVTNCPGVTPPAANLAMAMSLVSAFAISINNTRLNTSPAKWSVLSGGWSYTPPVGVQSTGGSPPGNIAVVETGLSDVYVALNGQVGGNSVGFTLRATDANNFWALEADVANHRIALSKVVAGVFTLVNSTAWGAAPGDPVRLVGSAIGTAFSIFEEVTGVGVAESGDSFNQTATKHGLFAWANVNEFVSSFAATNVPLS